MKVSELQAGALSWEDMRVRVDLEEPSDELAAADFSKAAIGAHGAPSPFPTSNNTRSLKCMALQEQQSHINLRLGYL